MALLHILRRIVSVCKLKVKATLEQQHKLISDHGTHRERERERERERLVTAEFQKRKERFDSN
jgi:hypothetical protein